RRDPAAGVDVRGADRHHRGSLVRYRVRGQLRAARAERCAALGPAGGAVRAVVFHGHGHVLVAREVAAAAGATTAARPTAAAWAVAATAHGVDVEHAGVVRIARDRHAGGFARGRQLRELDPYA